MIQCPLVLLFFFASLDECKAGASCGSHQFCLNLEGSHRCMNCDQACKKCHAEGPENCIECAEGFMRSSQDRKCIKVRDDQISHNFPQDSQSEGHERKLSMVFR